MLYWMVAVPAPHSLGLFALAAVALFFLAFMPQFVDPDRTVWTQVIVFGLTFVLLGLVSDSLYALLAGTPGRGLRRRRHALRYASGTVYVGLGAAAALTKR
jgi:threonine/homoserine/homoserine lactone efflux protein